MRTIKCASYSGLELASKKSCLLSTEIFLENSNGTIAASILVLRILRSLFDICKEIKASRMEQKLLLSLCPCKCPWTELQEARIKEYIRAFTEKGQK